MDVRQSPEEKIKQFNTIMRAIRRNPEKGLRQFYDKYKELIQTTAQVICRSIDKTNEVVDDVLVKFWNLSKTVGDITNPEGLIYIVTANTAKDAIRCKNELPLEEYYVEERNSIQSIIDDDSFYSLIKPLSEIEQTVMIHKFISGDTFQEIADEIHKPLATVTSIYYRALKKLSQK